MTKLTLRVDAGVVSRAKQYAATRKVSVSSLVETMLDLVSSPTARHRGAEVPAVLAQLRGSLKRGTVGDYRRYLTRKYR